jgi:hypothetical protein
VSQENVDKTRDFIAAPPEVVPPENAAELVQRFGGELLG